MAVEALRELPKLDDYELFGVHVEGGLKNKKDNANQKEMQSFPSVNDQRKNQHDEKHNEAVEYRKENPTSRGVGYS